MSLKIKERGKSMKKVKKDENNVASFMKFFSIIFVIVGVFASLVLFNMDVEELYVLPVVVSIISSIFIYALGEIIQLLQDIANNTKKEMR